MDPLLKKVFHSLVKAAGEDTIEFVASDESVDRHGDIIRASGWRLDEYKKNPVVLFGHNYNSFPVGKSPDIGLRGTQLIAPVKFARRESPEADIAYRLAEGGFLNGMSVGFMALQKETDPDICPGYIFTEQALYEVSLTPIPANPNAVQRAIISEQEADLWNAHVQKALGPGSEAFEVRLANMESSIGRMEKALNGLASSRAETENPLDGVLAALTKGASVGDLENQPVFKINPQTLARLMNQFVVQAVDKAVDEKIKYHLGTVD